ncbi:hypothetical protein ACFX13_036267 [Malus domestica]
MEHVEMTLQLEDGLLVGSRYNRSSKAAKQQEARQLSKELQGCRSLSKRRKLDSDHIDELSSEVMQIEPCSQLTDVVHSSEPISRIESSSAESENKSCPDQFWFQPSLPSQHCIPNLPAIASISTRKGEARISLFELCKVMQWPMPTFKITEQKSRTPIEFGEGSEKRMGSTATHGN